MKKIAFFIFLFLMNLVASFANSKLDPKLPYLSSALELNIGLKIWQNECGASLQGLIFWNVGEDFASLGIGHFLWDPGKQENSRADSFPQLIKYMQTHNIEIPSWLDKVIIPSCPWHNRMEFMRAQNDPKMHELQEFLVRTIPIQVQYLTYRLMMVIPKLLEATPENERDIVYRELYQLLQSPAGIYALIDYLNFKGDGILATRKSWGLLQVLEDMQHAPSNLKPVEAFAWAARHILIRRVLYSAPHRHEEKWLAGWLKRIDTYSSWVRCN
jgi:hypothetical protein